MDAEQVERFRQPILRLAEEVPDKYSASFFPYMSSSPAGTEARNGDKDLVATILEQSETALDSAGQHMKAMSLTLGSPDGVMVVPSYTLARTVLEACARAAWVLDPGVTTLERFSRSLVLLFEDRKSEVAIAKARHGPASALAKAQDTQWEGERGKILAKAEDIGVDVRRRATGGITHIGSQPISTKATAVVKSALDAEEAYRSLSGLEHQRTYRQRGMTTRAVRIAGTQQFKHERSMTELQYRWLVQSVVRWYGTATWRSFAYAGYDLNWMAKTLGEAAEIVELPECFWEAPEAVVEPFPE
ncbi:MAG: hypothetical protein OXH41_00410 [Chloroflexi bacterium]|nr:hypothetical protein [Chloroflexota bacterium]